MGDLGQVMSIAVKTGATFEAGAPKVLFRAETRNNNMTQYGVTENGQKFLVIEEPVSRAADDRMVVMTRWNALLR